MAEEETYDEFKARLKACGKDEFDDVLWDSYTDRLKSMKKIHGPWDGRTRAMAEFSEKKYPWPEGKGPNAKAEPEAEKDDADDGEGWDSDGDYGELTNEHLSWVFNAHGIRGVKRKDAPSSGAWGLLEAIGKDT